MTTTTDTPTTVDLAPLIALYPRCQALAEAITRDGWQAHESEFETLDAEARTAVETAANIIEGHYNDPQTAHTAERLSDDLRGALDLICGMWTLATVWDDVRADDPQIVAKGTWKLLHSCREQGAGTDVMLDLIDGFASDGLDDIDSNDMRLWVRSLES